MTTPALLDVQDISRRYLASGAPAVDALSLTVQAGEIVALIGPSGCGKTTSLRMIAGFEAPDSGRILLEGRDITALPPEARGIGMVFQDYGLFPHMTVGQNILFGASDRSAANLARHLAMVGLDGLAERYPDQLSGGQQQRVALARSFAAGPRLILLDEPFSNLDAALRGATRRELRRLLKAQGTGILFVTHDQEEALSFADRLVVMQGGCVQQQGSAQEVYDHPANTFVAGFLGRTNILPGTADGLSAATQLGPLPLSRPAQGPCQLSLRPERLTIRLANADEQPDGRILAAEFKGHDMTYLVRCGDLDLQVDAMQTTRLPEGAGVRLEVQGKVTPLQHSPPRQD